MSASGNGEFARRDFIRMGIAGVAGAWTAGQLTNNRAVVAAPATLIPIGLQLYSVRHDFGKDQAGILAAVSKFGFEGVEFAGYFNRTASELRKMLDENGLKCCGTHLGIDQVTGENLARTIEFNQALGNKLLIVPGLPPKRTATQQAWLENAKQFADLAEKLKPAGMRIGYHNHQSEFKPLEGKLPFDTFFGNTPKDVVMQVDVGTAVEAGADPKAVFEKYPGRAASIHVKEYSKTNPKAYVGEGDAKWQEIFDVLEKQGATEWYIVEYEIEGMPALDSVNRCLQNLRKMGK
jgi:sugar phosphate isomerase/epimerase